jgi:hypothetical protein
LKCVGGDGNVPLGVGSFTENLMGGDGIVDDHENCGAVTTMKGVEMHAEQDESFYNVRSLCTAMALVGTRRSGFFSGLATRSRNWIYSFQPVAGLPGIA